MASDQTPTDAALELGLRKSQIWAALVLYVEALGILAFTAYLFWGLVSGQSKSAAAEAGLVVLYFLVVVSLERAARAILQGKRWGRSWSVFWQTAQLFLASQSFTGGGANWFIGGYLIITAIAALVPLFTRAAIAHARKEMQG